MFLFCGFAAMMTSRAERTIHLIGVSATPYTKTPPKQPPLLNKKKKNTPPPQTP